MVGKTLSGCILMLKTRLGSDYCGQFHYELMRDNAMLLTATENGKVKKYTFSSDIDIHELIASFMVQKNS